MRRGGHRCRGLGQGADVGPTDGAGHGPRGGRPVRCADGGRCCEERQVAMVKNGMASRG